MPPPPMNRRSSSGAFPDSDKNTPPHGSIVFSDNGLMLKGTEGGKLLPGQKFALRIITGMVHSRQLIGRWSLRSALVFHAMGSGKTVVVHALLNYIAGLVRNNKSAACRVVLMWQHESAMRENERKIRSNEYNVFAAPVRVGPNEPIHDNLMFSTLSARDTVLGAMQLMTATMRADIDERITNKNTARAAVVQMDTEITDVNTKLKRAKLNKQNAEDARGTDGRLPSSYKNEISRLTQELAELEKKKEVQEKGKSAKVQIDRASCTSANRALFVVDEVHDLIGEPNVETYLALLTGVFCDHARVVLMSGTPVSSVSPITDIARLLLLIGGRPFFLWVMSGTQRETRGAAALVAFVQGLGYGTLDKLTIRGFSASRPEFRDVLKKPTHGALGKILSETNVHLDYLKSKMREVEARMFAIISHAAKADPTLAAFKRTLFDLAQHSSIVVSYYGLANGNRVEYTKTRENFTEYKYDEIVRAIEPALHQECVLEPLVARLGDAGHDVVRRILEGDGTVRIKRGAGATGAGTYRYVGKGPKAVVTTPGFSQSGARYLVATVPPYALHADRAARMSSTEIAHGVSAAEIAKWLTANITMHESWTNANDASKEAEVSRNYGRYALAWALCVSILAARAAFESNAEHQNATAVVLMVDRLSYGAMGAAATMSRLEMELVVHYVMRHAKGHKVLGNAYTPYILAFDSTVTAASAAEARAMQGEAPEHTQEDEDDDDAAAFGTAFGKPPMRSKRKRVLLPRRSSIKKEHVGLPAAPAAPAATRDKDTDKNKNKDNDDEDNNDRSTNSKSKNKEDEDDGGPGPAMVGETVVPIIGFDLVGAHREAQGKYGAADAAAAKNPTGKLILVQDMYTIHEGVDQLGVEGHSYDKYDGLIVVGIPRMSATKARQLVARIDRVNASEGRTARRRFVMFIRAPRMATLDDIGSDLSERQVAAIEDVLVRVARDCDLNVTDAERAAFKCAKTKAGLMEVYV